MVSYSVANDKKFRAAVKRAYKKVGDLEIPLTEISIDFFKSQQAVFNKKGPGQWPDLNPDYKEIKQEKWGFVYPILVASGRLKDSTTNPLHPDSINYITPSKDALVIGTKVPYAQRHQQDSGRTNFPLRKFLFIGPESIKAAKGDPIKGRLQRWLGILRDYTQEVLEKEKRRGR